MKKIKLNIVLVFAIFAMTNCSKDDVIKKSHQIEPPRLVQTLEAPKYYAPASCILVDENDVKIKGTMCDLSPWSTEACPKYKECTATSPDMINKYFTIEEIERWENGENIFKQESSYYKDHYGFFMHLFKEKMCNHPDTIIANLISLGL